MYTCAWQGQGLLHWEGLCWEVCRILQTYLVILKGGNLPVEAPSRMPLGGPSSPVGTTTHSRPLCSTHI